MPIQSRYSNEEFEGLMQDIFATLEKNNANRDLSIMALGNVLASLFKNSVSDKDRTFMVEQFCSALKSSSLDKGQ